MKNQIQTCTLLCMLAITFSSYAQQTSVTKGSVYKMKMKKGGWADIEPIGSDAAGVYYILHPFSKIYSGAYIGSKDAYIGKVGTDMSLENFEVLPMQYEDKEMELEFGLELNNTSYVFTSFENNQLKKSFLFAQTVDRETLKPNGDFMKVAEIDYSAENKYKSTAYSYRLSGDSSKVLLTHNLVDKDGSLLSFGYTVTDARLKPLGTVSDIGLLDEGIYSFQDYFISPLGEVYLLVRYFDEKKEFNKNTKLKKQGFLSSTRSLEVEATYDHKILKFKDFSSTPKEVVVSVPDVFVTSLLLCPKVDGGAISIGFYSDDEDAIPDGVFTQDLGKDLQVIKTEKRSLNGEFAQPSKYVNNTYVPTGLIKTRDDLTNFRFVLKDIIRKESGGYVLAAERTTTLTKTQTSGQTRTTYVVYHTDDIAVIDVKPSGEINWIEKVEKAQESTGLGTFYTSYSLAEYEDNLMLFFADLSEHNVKLIGKIVDTESCMVKINPDGKQTREVIFTADDDEITLRASSAYEASKGSYILYGQNGLAKVGFIHAGF